MTRSVSDSSDGQSKTQSLSSATSRQTGLQKILRAKSFADRWRLFYRSAIFQTAMALSSDNDNTFSNFIKNVIQFVQVVALCFFNLNWYELQAELRC